VAHLSSELSEGAKSGDEKQETPDSTAKLEVAHTLWLDRWIQIIRLFNPKLILKDS